MQSGAQSIGAPIGRLRRRIWERRALIAACIGVSVTALVMLSTPGATALMPGALLIAAGAAAGLSLFGLPSDLSIARRLDQRLRLGEKLSTAIELRRAAAPAGTIARLQLQDAARSGARIDVRRAAPVLSPLAIAAVVVALCSSGLALWSPWRAAAPVELTTDAPSPETSGRSIAEIAELVASDAEARDDQYLAALARALAELAGTELSPAERDRRLSDLLEQARKAYGDVLPAWFPASDAPPAAGSVPTDTEGAAPTTPGSTETLSSREMYSADEGQKQRAAAADAAAADAAARASDAAELPKPGGSSEPQLMGEQPMQSIGLRPAGAAADSGKDGGNAAGLGSQPLGGDQDEAASAATEREDVALAADDTEAGAGLMQQVAPRINLVAVDGRLDDAGLEWTRQRAETVSREPVSADAAAVVARYFEPQSP